MDKLRERLEDVAGGQDEIVSISNAAFQLADAEKGEFVRAWLDEVKRHRQNCIGLVYIANDIVQKSLRKNDAFLKEFKKVMPEAVRAIEDVGNRQRIIRVLTIWGERGVFSRDFVNALKRNIGGEAPEVVAEESQLLLSPQVVDDDEEDEDDEEDDEDDEDDYDLEGAGLGNDAGGPMLKRNDSTVSVQDIPLSNLIVATRTRYDEHVKLLKEHEKVDEELQSAMDKAGTKPDAYLSKLTDVEVDALFQKLKTHLKGTNTLKDKLDALSSLEGALISVLEFRVEDFMQRSDKAQKRMELTTKLEERIAKLAAAHPGTAAISTTVQRKQKVLKEDAQTAAARKRARSSSGSSSSEEDDDEDEEEEEDEEAGATNNGEGGQEGEGDDKERRGINVLLKRRKRKKKKKKTETKTTSTPMIYNHVLKMYVPMPSMDEQESWRDH